MKIYNYFEKRDEITTKMKSGGKNNIHKLEKFLIFYMGETLIIQYQMSVCVVNLINTTYRPSTI